MATFTRRKRNKLIILTGNITNTNLLTQLDSLLDGVTDTNLKFTLAFGVGIHHAGLKENDRKCVEELFVNQKIQVRLYIWYMSFH